MLTRFCNWANSRVDAMGEEDYKPKNDFKNQFLDNLALTVIPMITKLEVNKK